MSAKANQEHINSTCSELTTPDQIAQRTGTVNACHRFSIFRNADQVQRNSSTNSRQQKPLRVLPIGAMSCDASSNRSEIKGVSSSPLGLSKQTSRNADSARLDTEEKSARRASFVLNHRHSVSEATCACASHFQG